MLKMVPGRGPGRSREIMEDPRGLLGSPGAEPGSCLDSGGPPLGAVWASFWVNFSILFLLNFEMPFLMILGRILAAFWLHFGTQNRLREPLDTKRSIFKKPCFT